MNKAEILGSPELVRLADALRTEAAALILKEKENDNDIFYEHLIHSILEIPAFSPDARTTPEKKDASFKSLQNLKYPEAVNDITEIGAAIEPATTSTGLTSEQKKMLKRFYSNFIIQKDKGKYFNYLDLSFLHVLPKIDKASIPTIKCAVVNNNMIYAKLDGDSITEFNSDSIFVEYDGEVHYKAIEMDHPKTKKKIDSFIAEWKNEAIDGLLELDSAKEIKRRLTEEIRYYDPQAYTACCRLIWKHFHDQWVRDNAPNYGEPAIHREPGRPYPYQDIPLQEGKTIRSPQTSVVLDVQAFGNWKLNDLSQDELKTLPKSKEFRATKIADAMKGIPPA